MKRLIQFDYLKDENQFYKISSSLSKWNHQNLVIFKI